MPLELSDPPPNAYRLVADAISRVSAAEGAPSALANVPDPGRLSSVLHHKVFTLGAQDIVQGRNLTSARLTSWRFLIKYRTQILGAVELSCDLRGSNLRFLSLDTGPFAKATYDVAAQAERMPGVTNGSYELRVLKAPSVYVMAAWLKDLNGSQDIVVPINPGQNVTATMSLGGTSPTQSSSDFIKSMRASAKQSLNFDSRPTTDDGLEDSAGGLPRRR